MSRGNDGGRGSVSPAVDAAANDAPVEVRPKVRIIPVEGVFDEAAARNIDAKLAEVGWDVVIVDFHAARTISDVALFVLALATRRLLCPAVMLRGLRAHDHRMLRYFENAPGFRPDGLAH
jgi:hypothetical protein